MHHTAPGHPHQMSMVTREVSITRRPVLGPFLVLHRKQRMESKDPRTCFQTMAKRTVMVYV